MQHQVTVSMNISIVALEYFLIKDPCFLRSGVPGDTSLAADVARSGREQTRRRERP